MRRFLGIVLSGCFLMAAGAQAQTKVSPEREASIKADMAGQIDGMKKRAQVMVDTVFSFGELLSGLPCEGHHCLSASSPVWILVGHRLNQGNRCRE